MKEKQLNAIAREEIYEARLKKLARFKEKIKRAGFRRTEVETCIVKDYIVLNQ